MAELVEWSKDRNLLALFVLFFSTPIIGVAISTITLGILFLRYGYRIFYYPPNSSKIVEYILKNDLNLKNQIVNTSSLVWTRKNLESFYPYYQAKVKDCITGEKLSFLERRWSTYWTHVNNISATLFSFAIAVALRFFNECDFCCVSFDKSAYKFIGLIFIITYCFVAYFHLTMSRKDASNFEYIVLEKVIKEEEESEKKKEAKAEKPLTWLSLLTKILKL